MTTQAPSRSDVARSGRAPKAAKTPVGPGAITVVGVLLSLAVIALGALGLQAAASAAGLTEASPWLSDAVTSVDGLRALSWMLPVAILLLAAGLYLLLVALRPRPRTAIELRAATGVLIRPRDLARLVEHAAEDVDGVADVRVRASRTKIAVLVDSTGGPHVAADVKAAVSEMLHPLDKAPRLSVKTKEVAL